MPPDQNEYETPSEPTDLPDVPESVDPFNPAAFETPESEPEADIDRQNVSAAADIFDSLPSLLPPVPVPPVTPFAAQTSARFPSLGRTPGDSYRPVNQPANPPSPKAAGPESSVSAAVEPVPGAKRPLTSPASRSASLSDDPGDDDPAEIADVLPRSRPIEPALVYLILLAVMVLGLGGLAPAVRYTALWTILIGMAILAMLFDNLEVEIPTAPDMAWGIGYGVILGLPLLIIALPQLQHTSLLLFDRTSDTLAFQSLAIVMPTAESLFFRGALQPTRGLLFAALAGSAWSMLLFFPQLHVVEAPLVAIVIGFAFVVLNFLYSYIKRRFGLFASWACQITITVLLLFVCRFL